MAILVEIYTTKQCPYCVRAKNYLNERGLEFTEIDVSNDAEMRMKLVEKSGGRKTVPQIFINGKPIGGYDDMMELVRSGKFDSILQES